MEEDTPKTPGGGLELDKIEISLPRLSASPPPRSPEPLAPPPETEEKGGRWWMLWSVLIAALTAGTFIGIYRYKADTALAPIAWNSSGASQDYLTVGPVYATLATSEVVFLSVEIGCPTKEVKNKLSGMEPVLKDRIIAVMGDPETGRLFAAKDFDGVKTRIKADLGAATQEPIGDVFFSQMLRY
jgi:hypothetical protein